MRQLNGVFTRFATVATTEPGHLFQGRFKSILRTGSYLLELSRYVVLNRSAWAWWVPRQIGCGAAIGQRPANALRRHFTTDALLSTFGKRKQKARERYVRFVAEGLGRGPMAPLFCSNRSTCDEAL